MDTTTLQEYRRRLSEEVFVCRRDALFDLADALLTYPQARSLVELSEAPLFAHRWPSLYSALSDGEMDPVALCSLCVQHLPHPQTRVTHLPCPSWLELLLGSGAAPTGEQLDVGAGCAASAQ